MPVRRDRDHHRILPALGAFAATASVLLDTLAAATEERDDHLRRYAVALEAWAGDRLSYRDLRSTSDELPKEAWKTSAPSERSAPWGAAEHAVNTLESVRVEVMQYPTHAPRAFDRLLWRYAAVLTALGEAPEAARARVERLFVERFAALTGAAPPEAWNLKAEPPPRSG